MRINTNLSAMTALNNSTKTTALASNSMEKLSSGLKINKAGDDAAGLAISEKMRSQIRGLDQASENAQDGISVVQTAEGAMEEIGNITQRMRELTVQASNETNNVEDREKITTELKQLHSEIDRIAESTQFNGKTLLSNTVKGSAELNGKGLEGAINGLSNFDKVVDTNGELTPLSGLIKGGSIELTNADPATSDDYSLVIKDKNGDVIATADAVAIDSNGDITFELLDAEGNEFQERQGDNSVADIVNKEITISVSNFEELKGNALLDGNNTVKINIDGKTEDLKMDLQVGANTGDSEKLTVNIANMSTNALGLKETDIDDILNSDLTKGTEAAKSYIDKLDEALKTVNTNRASLGAYQNRLETAQSNLTTSSENLTAAESRIRDVDVAAEMMNLSKLNLINQAAQAMMTQAKSQPEGVMQLLR